MAKDSDYKGKNLLGGDSLKVVFNEKSGSDQSFLTITGVVADMLRMLRLNSEKTLYFNKRSFYESFRANGRGGEPQD